MSALDCPPVMFGVLDICSWRAVGGNYVQCWHAPTVGSVNAKLQSKSRLCDDYFLRDVQRQSTNPTALAQLPVSPYLDLYSKELSFAHLYTSVPSKICQISNNSLDMSHSVMLVYLIVPSHRYPRRVQQGRLNDDFFLLVRACVRSA
jgi:hypothetical protein